MYAYVPEALISFPCNSNLVRIMIYIYLFIYSISENLMYVNQYILSVRTSLDSII